MEKINEMKKLTVAWAEQCDDEKTYLASWDVEKNEEYYVGKSAGEKINKAIMGTSFVCVVTICPTDRSKGKKEKREKMELHIGKRFKL